MPLFKKAASTSEDLAAKLADLELQKGQAVLDFEKTINVIKLQLQTAKESETSLQDVEVALDDKEDDDTTKESVVGDNDGSDEHETGDEEADREGLVDVPDLCPRRASSAQNLIQEPLHPSEETFSVYRKPLSPADAAKAVPPGEEGLIYHAQVVSARYDYAKDIAADGEINPRRPIPTVKKDDFFNSLTKTEDGRWIFSGVLNGWPALREFELRSITVLKGAKSYRKKIVRLWQFGKSKDAPAYPLHKDKEPRAVRVTLRGPAWTTYGWTPESQGHVWWYAGHVAQKWFKHGTDMIKHVTNAPGPIPVATQVHGFAHRYARGKTLETRKNKQTYHTGVLIEWNHKHFCTVVELATLNGVGGRFGKSNWFDDKFSDRPELYKAMPACMIAPWKGEFAEIRCTDVASKTKEEFMAYMEKHTGQFKYFLLPQWAKAGEIRLTHNTQADIMQYLISYTARDRRYTEEFRNCQTFYADFLSFLTGKKDVEPFHQANRLLYRPRTHLFLYDPAKYEFATPDVLHK